MRPAWIALAAWIFCIAGSIGIHLYVGRRRFYRTNAAGVEEFESYGRAVRSQLFEAFLALLNLVFLLGGMIAMFLVATASPRYW
jgi:hypothetical protein